MENASKALILAGGMLIAIMLVTLLRYAWGLFSDYQSSNDKLANIENIAKFNQQFTNYDRDDVKGYEIISLVNQIVDYNERKSTLGSNDQRYNNITINISLGSQALIKQYLSEDLSHIKLFTQTTYNQTTFNTNILQQAKNQEIIFGGVDAITKITKDRGSIFLNDDVGDLAQWRKAADKFNAYSQAQTAKINITSTSSVANLRGQINSYKNNILTYYEYYNFKKAKFRCTNVSYNDGSIDVNINDGRINTISFEFTG